LNLIAFPLKHENPFPIKVKVGEPVKVDDSTMIVCTGTGSKGAEVLGAVLSNYPEVERVIEFGSAATVSKGEIGSLYECTLFLSFEGVVLATTGRFTKLPVTAVTGSDELYLGKDFEWALQLAFPLLYTQESLVFRNVATEFRKDFTSIRIVTDDGTGDIRSQVAYHINNSRKKISAVFRDI
jgi:hypothetical protein